MEHLIIAGRVGQDAVIKDFNGNQYTSFSIAVDNSYKKPDGTKVDQTNWYNCLKSGIGLATYIKKGQFLVVSGQPKPKIYKDNQGYYQISLNMRAETITLGPNASNNGSNHQHPQENNSPQNYPSTQVPTAMSSNEGDSNDDLPF